MTADAGSTIHRRRVAVFVASALLTLAALQLGAQFVGAEYISRNCSGATCNSQTYYYISSGLYITHGVDSVPGAPFYVVGADTYGYSRYHIGSQGAANDHNWCYQGNSYGCLTPSVIPCTTDAYPLGCGGGMAKWYSTTLHEYLRYSWTYDSFFTSSDGTRSSSYCWYGGYSCIY